MKQTHNVICIYMGETREPKACEIYRGNLPLYYLSQAQGWETGWTYFEDLLRIQAQMSPAALWMSLVQNHDIFVFPRFFLPTDPTGESYNYAAAMFSFLRKAGKRIVYEIDDDYTNRHRTVIDGDAMQIAKWADAITVTTPMLRDLMRKETGNLPTYVLPNMIDPGLWREEERAELPQLAGKTVIGLTGSSTHGEDWRVLTDVMKPILEARPDVHFLVMGFHPDYLDDLPQTTYLPGSEYLTYSHIIRQCDAILAPVNDDPFNVSKSPIKAIEGMGATRNLHNVMQAGAAVIATNNPVYQLAIRDGETGLLVEHTPQAWQEAIERVLDDAELRNKLQRNGFEWVYKHHDISKGWVDWSRAYTKILAAPSSNTPIIPKVLSER